MWFIFALASSVFAGIHTFSQKIAVERGYDSSLLNAVSALVSCIGAVLFFTATSSWAHVPFGLFELGVLSGAVFIFVSVLRMEGLRFIDSAIFFPLYKVIGPAVAAAIGVAFLGDVLSKNDVIGIALSCLVPLLLISKHEHHRQKNLTVGLVFMLASTVLASISAGINAYALHSFPSQSLEIPLLAVAHGFTALFGFALFTRKHTWSHVREAYMSCLTRPFILFAIVVGGLQFLAFYSLLLALSGGALSIVYSINAHYIVIPVLLSVWLYGEHWNTSKAFALAVSIVALVFLHH